MARSGKATYDSLLRRQRSAEQEYQAAEKRYEANGYKIKKTAALFLEKAFSFLEEKVSIPETERLHFSLKMFEYELSRSLERKTYLVDHHKWIQELFTSGKYSTQQKTFAELNHYFSYKSQNFQQLACEVSFLFEQWESYITIELITVPEKELWIPEYRTRRTSRGQCRYMYRNVRHRIPELGYFSLTFKKLPPDLHTVIR